MSNIPLCPKEFPRAKPKGTPEAQLSINGVGLTKPLTTSLNPTSKHSSHLRKPSKVVSRGEVGITGYQPNIDAW